MRFKMILLPLLLSLPVVANAESWFGGEFSADVVMTSPENPANQAQGKIFVGNQKVRAQGEHQGVAKAVVIDDPARKAWTILDNSKQYYEGLAQAPIPIPDVDILPTDPPSRCNTDKGPKCTKAGQEKVGGILADKWQISATNPQNNQTITNLLWADPQRHIVVRQQPEKGPSMERLLLATEAVEGRPTEKWEFVNTYNNQSRKSTQWVDAKLRVVVRMMVEGKVLTEVKNIKEGAQAAELFQVPAGYQQVAMPQPPKPAQGAGAPPAAK